MTTKKKVGISDLLRDEVQKGTESTISNEPIEKTIEVKAETVSDAVSDRVKIATLESELNRSQKRESEHLQTISDLQKDLKLSQTNVELLQNSLAAIESLKNESDRQLVEVKRDNLRLAEANIQLSGQLSERGKSPAELTSTKPVEAPLNSQLVSQNPQDSQNNLQQNRATPRKQPVEQPYPNRDRSPYVRPTGSNEQLQRVNNKNIGWMD